MTGDRLPPVEEAGQGCLAILLLLLLIGLGVGSILTYWYIFVPVVLVASTLLIVAFKRGMGPRV